MIRILVLEDEADKYFEVRRALEYSGVSGIDRVRNQEDGFDLSSRLNFP